MHLVFYRTDFASIDDAARSNDPHALLVMSVLFETKIDSTSTSQDFTEKFSDIAVAGQKVKHDFGGILFTSFLPDNLKKFYSFDGSLTTPPCSPVTLWVVFDTVKQISEVKMDHFGHILNVNGEEVTHNYRKLQDLKDRRIYVYNLYHRRHSFGTLSARISNPVHRNRGVSLSARLFE